MLQAKLTRFARLRKELIMSKDVECPKCGSSSVDASQSGVNLGMAALGAFSFGVIGGLAGAASGSTEVKCICKNCGFVWSPQKHFEEKRRQIEQIKSDIKNKETAAWLKQHRENEAANEKIKEAKRLKRIEENATERKARNDPWPASVKWQCFTSIVDGFLVYLVITLPLWFFFGLSVAAWTHTVIMALVLRDALRPYEYDENEKEFGGRAAFYVIVIPIGVLSALIWWAAAYDASH